MESHSKSQKKIKCSDCHYFSNNPVLGHFKCIRHRACSGQQDWQPEECDVCNLFRHNSRGWQNEKRVEELDKLYKILQETSRELSNDEGTWNFMDTFNSFFNLQEPQIEQAEEGEIIDSEPQEVETNEGGVTNSNENIEVGDQSPEVPTTNDLLYKIIDGFQGLSGALRPIISQIQNRDANNENRSRRRRRSRAPKRRRSPEPSRPESDVSYESEYQSDSSRNEDHRRSPSPGASRTGTKRKRGNDLFTEGSTIYFYTDNHRRVGNRVWFDGQLRDAKWHPTKDAFSLLSSPTIETPYMSAIQAHESLVSHFRTTQDPMDKPGLDRKAYRVHLDDSTGLAHALRIIKQETPDALHCLYTNELNNFWKFFKNPCFKTATMSNFSSGWFLSDQKYLDWAKKDQLTTYGFSREVILSYIPFVPPKYLEEECKARARVADAITGLSMLDSLAKEVKSNVTVHTSVEAIARHYLSVLRETTLHWYIAKMNVRKIVLQGSQAPQAGELIESNMWEPDIFGKDIVKRIKDTDVQGQGVQKRLGLSKFVNDYYKRSPNLVSPDKLGKQPISTIASTSSDQFFHQQISRPRTNNSNQNAGQYNKNKQFQNNYNGRGASPQHKGGFTDQKNKRISVNKKKNWNPTKQKHNGQSGFSGGPKGNKPPQQ